VQYSSAEVFGLLHIIEQILPVDGEHWNEVSRLHLVNFPNNGRDGLKLKRKFQQLHHSHVPTGDFKDLIPDRLRLILQKARSSLSLLLWTTN
jgi:hypothetical protein